MEEKSRKIQNKKLRRFPKVVEDQHRPLPDLNPNQIISVIYTLDKITLYG